jgi:hypothetical protein
VTEISRAGAARCDITPDWPVMLGGFGQRTTPSTGVLHRIAAKALFLDDGRTPILIVTADLICIPKALGAAVGGALSAALGLPLDQILVCASHSHSAPQPIAAEGDETGLGYQNFLIERMISVGQAAASAMRPARIAASVGHFGALLNRRTRGAPNRIDPRVPIIAVREAEHGAPIALLFGLGCHPVTLGWDNMEISGDFPGVAQDAIEAALPGVTALFVNMTEGDVVPASSPNRDALDPRGYCGGGAEIAESMGKDLAAIVLQAYAQCGSGEPLQLYAKRRDLRCAPNFSALAPEQTIQGLAEADAVLARYLGADYERALPPGPLWSVASEVVVRDDLSEEAMRELMIACCRALGLRQRLGRSPPRGVDTPIQVLRIQDMTFLALPGEVLVAVGEAWSAKAGANAFIIGLANSHLRYLPLRLHFEEPEADQCYETVTAGLAAGEVDRALDEAAAMLGAVDG